MTTNNKLDKSFGPVGTLAGVKILIVGVILTIFSLYGLILIFLGAFVGLSSTSTLIDYDKKRIKFSNNLFGIFRIGKWIAVTTNMKIGIKKSDKTWRTYSRGNRTLDTPDHGFRIILYDSTNKQIMPVMKTETLDSAKIEIEKLSNQLGLGLLDLS
jgi:hypothetical protein